MTMPNFLIIGQSKAGTTALYHTLKMHPDVFMSPVKEPRFFVCEGSPPRFAGPITQLKGITRLEDYQALFARVTTEKAIGEASPQYLYAGLTERTVCSIRSYIPQARLVAILRHPAERVYSRFNYLQTRWSKEPAYSLRQALAEEQNGRRVGWHEALRYIEGNKTWLALKAYYNCFPRSQLKIYLYEEWKQQPQRVLADLFTFLDVDPAFAPPVNTRVNVTRQVRSQAMYTWFKHPGHIKAFLKRLMSQSIRRNLMQTTHRWNSVALSPIDPELHRELTEAFREDILQTQDLIERDLSHWLE
jgi:hypothetical protein